MISILALTWMLAQIIKKPEYESFVSIEKYQLIISAILLISIYGAVQLSCVIAENFAGGDPLTISIEYIHNFTHNILIKTILALEGGKTFSQYWASMTFRMGLSVWGLAYAGFPSFALLEKIFDFLILIISPFTASIIVQQIILETIKAIAIPFILPIGVMLRIFPPTRDAGSFLIASAISFQIIYPYTYVMHKEIVQKQMAEVREGFGEYLETRGITEEISISHIFSAISLNLDIFLFRPITLFSFVLLQGLFLPTLSMIITISFINGLTKFFNQKMG